MHIRELAEQTGLSADTLRFYEQKGLLTARHVTRQANGYRLYTPAALIRLRFIRLGQAMGFSLAQIGDYIQRWEAGDIPVEEKVVIYEAQIHKLDQQISQLQQMRDYLHEKRSQLVCNRSDTVSAGP